jgi:tetratricopeptide (TPR) repeat protein
MAKGSLARIWGGAALAALLAVASLCWAGAMEEMESELATDNISSGLAAHARGDHDGAIARYTQAISSGALAKESLAIAYNNRGNAYDDKGDTAKAIADYDQALRLNPLFTETYFNRAFARHRLGNFQDALKDYDRLLSLEPALAGGYFNRSFTWAALGRLDKAVADVRKALELSPGNTKYRDQLQDWQEMQAAPPAKTR